MTKRILLSDLDYSPDTGIFTWNKNIGKKIKKNDVAGTLTKANYIRIAIKRKSYMAHRLAWLYMTNEWPTKEIDHRNRIKNDNRWVNLRIASDKDQQGNYNLRRNNTSGFRRVTWHKRDKVWQAYICMNYKQKYLGSFSSKEEAKQAYDKAAVRYFGEFYID